MNIVQRLFKNTLIMYAGGIITNFIGFICLLYLARVIGPDNFGKINFSLAIVGYFGILINLGVPLFSVKEISIRRDNLEELRLYVGNIVSLQILLALTAYLLLLLFSFFINKPLEIKYLLMFYGLTLLSNSFYIDWAFQAVEKVKYMVLPKIVASLFYAILLISLVKRPDKILFVPLFYFLGGIVGFSISILTFIKKFGTFRLNFNISAFKNIIARALPIGISSILVNALYQLPTVMLGFMRSNQEVGLYNAGYKFVSLLLAAVATYYSALFPITSYYYNKSPQYFSRVIRSTIKLMFIVALPLSFGGSILAKPLLGLIYGTKFIEGSAVLEILIWDVLLVYVGTIFGQALLASGKQKELSLILTLMTIICLVLNFILIPILGIVGSALAIVITEIFGISLQYIRLSKIVRIQLHRFIVKPLFASLIMAFCVFNLSNHSKFQAIILIPIGASIYFLVLYLLKGITKKEINIIFTVKKQ